MKEIINKLKEYKNQSGYTKWLMRYSLPYMPQIILMLVINVICSAISAELSIVSKNIIDSATDGNFVLRAIIIYLILTLVSLGLSAAISVISIVLDEKFSFGIRKNLYQKIIESTWGDIKKYHTGDMMTRMTTDAGNISNGIIYTIPNIIRLVIELFIMFGILYYYEPSLAIMSLVIAPIAAVICFVLGRKLKKLQVKVLESEAAYRSFLQESVSNLLIVKAFGNEESSINKLVDLREERFYWVRKKANMGIISSSTMSLSFQIAYIVAFTLGALKVAEGSITYGTMALFLTMVGRIQSPIIQLAENVPKIVSIIASTGRVMELQNIKKENYEKSDIKEENIGVSVNNLTFGYSEQETVLEDISLGIEPGEFVAIVGESGIGKTTLVRLMMSFLEGQKGDVTFFNKEGQTKLANAAARSFISYVPQGNTLFSGTIRENILMGNENASEAEIEEALKMAAAYEFVQELPKGADTVIGEKGYGISEGQAQRIAIARAIVKKAPFLILDEATSSLDAKTELEVLEGIKKLNPKPTCLLITHRKTVLDYCDREIKIEHKQIL
ncbi:MAG: ABC transporter ATP-binding protein [Lachnospiraceae bacterium]|nr:ABC transporter ATP-binding protein [Lachnospiraceae bacterium]